MITIKIRKDYIHDDKKDIIVYFIDLIKKVNGVENIFHIGMKTEMEYYNFISMLDFLNVKYCFLNVEYKIDEDWLED